jgi:hypothetical protein
MAGSSPPGRPRRRTLHVLLEARLREVVASHFDPRWGSRYWIEKAAARGLDVGRDLRVIEDLDALGLMDGRDLVRRSVWDFVPRRFAAERRNLVTAETGGTLGTPRRTVYHGDDFHAAFVEPFVRATERLAPFPRGAVWLWIGPSGPHIVGKAARAVCAALDSPDPFAVDFDPRWFKSQTPGSLGRERYLEHVLAQSRGVLAHEPVEVLFSTPPVLLELARRLDPDRRRAIRGVHLGGLACAPGVAAKLLELFPAAACAGGYGNTLLGMCPQLEDRQLEAPRYFPHGARLHLRLVGDSGRWLRTVAYGERGRVLATRLDPSFLIVNLMERDTAVRVPPPPGAACEGFLGDGLESPRPGEEVPAERVGIY